MKLFHAPGTRSTRILWTLEEIGQPYELVTLTREQRSSPEHALRHPLGRVPVLELDPGQYVFESAAICLQLADMYQDAGLIGPTGSYERALTYQWSVFAVTELEPKSANWRAARRNNEDETPHAAAFAPVSAALTHALEANAWLTGSTFTVADVLIATMLATAVNHDLVPADGPIPAYVERAQQRPAYLRADAVNTESQSALA